MGLGRPLIAILATLGVWLSSPLLAWMTGDTSWYPVPLLAGLVVVMRLGRLDRRTAGFRRGAGFYRPGTLHALLVVGGCVWLATAFSATRVAGTGLGTLGLQVMTMTVVSGLGLVVTEEGFFRGALWGLLDRWGRSTDTILLWTSAAGALWFLPLLLLEPEMGGSVESTAVHVLNVWLLGMCWGVIRLASGSVLAAAWAHGLWNGLAYTLFGFGPADGALGLNDLLRLDPERGWAGVALNAAAFLLLWRWWQRRELVRIAEETEAAASDAESA